MSFPLLHQNVDPFDDISHVKALLEVIGRTLEGAAERGMSASVASDLLFVLCDLRDKVDPVARFVEVLDYPQMLADYQKARRAVIAAGQVDAAL